MTQVEEEVRRNYRAFLEISPSVLQVKAMEMIETKTDSDDWDVLIGRDVLKSAIFTTDFAGHFAIAVR